jgi:hypothetical protein
MTVAGRLADREVGGGPRSRWRALEARKRCPNQRPVDGAFIVCRPRLGIAGSGRWSLLSRRLIAIGRGVRHFDWR